MTDREKRHRAWEKFCKDNAYDRSSPHQYNWWKENYWTPNSKNKCHDECEYDKKKEKCGDRLPPIEFYPPYSGIIGTKGSPIEFLQTNVEQLYAHLDGDSEVPPVNTHGTGRAEVEIDRFCRKLELNLSFECLEGATTSGHIHFGKAGENGPVVFDLDLPVGYHELCDVYRKFNLSDEQVKLFLENKYYINIHTDRYEDGEIRGQIIFNECGCYDDVCCQVEVVNVNINC